MGCQRSPEAFWGRRWVGNSRCELEAQGRGHGCHLLSAMGATETLRVNEGSQGGQNETTKESTEYKENQEGAGTTEGKQAME